MSPLRESDLLPPLPAGTYFLRRDPRLGRRSTAVKAKGWRFYEAKPLLALPLVLPEYLLHDENHERLQEAVTLGLRPVRGARLWLLDVFVGALNGILLLQHLASLLRGHWSALALALINCLGLVFYLLTVRATPRPLDLQVALEEDLLPEAYSKRLLLARFRRTAVVPPAGVTPGASPSTSSGHAALFHGTFGEAYPTLPMVQEALSQPPEGPLRLRKQWLKTFQEEQRQRRALESELVRYGQLPESRKLGERLLQLEERAAVLHLVRLGAQEGLVMEQPQALPPGGMP